LSDEQKFGYGQIIDGRIVEVRECFGGGDHLEIIILADDNKKYKFNIDAYDQDGNMPNTTITVIKNE
jgi:hypothetical protein